jgi:putative redox protein
MEPGLRSGDLLLAAHLAKPRTLAAGVPAVVICHAFHSADVPDPAATLPELADRIAQEMGWLALVFNYRGCGASKGQFSLGGWLRDVLAAIDHAGRQDGAREVWLLGFGTGGALAICAAAREPRVKGVVSVAAPADFDDWASHPRRLLEHSRERRLITDPAFPPSMELWARELRDLRAVACVAQMAPRPLLIVHGQDDDQVPVFDARVLGDAHGSADLRIIPGGGHQLRHDPRAVAVIMGWLDRRQQSR